MEASQAISDIRRIIRGEVRAGVPLDRYTTLRVGGPADILAVPEDMGELERLVRYAARCGLPLYVLGHGSNVLVPDEGVRGLVVVLTKAAAWVRFEGAEVEAGAGCPLPRLVQMAARRSLAGLEGLAGVPGTVGGALFMNAGTAGASIGDVTLWVEVLDREGERVRLAREEMGFGYRTSRLQRGGLIAVSARLGLAPGDPAAIAAALRAAAQRRRATQPLEQPNAGSVFKNPPGDFAGRLIEAAGCKGWRSGGAEVSPRHANFIVNLGGATAGDVLRLMARVHRRVREAFGVSLEPEIRLFGAPQEELIRYLATAGDGERDGLGR